MASVSFEVARDSGKVTSLTAGSDMIVLGTAAPTTGNTLQLRVDLAGSWRREEVFLALDRIKEAVTANPDILL